jgi:hypothetical protein
MRKASPELCAEFWVRAQGSTHFTARKLTGDHNSAISVIRGRPNAESSVAATRQVVVNRSLLIRCVLQTAQGTKMYTSNCFCSKIILPLVHVENRKNADSLSGSTRSRAEGAIPTDWCFQALSSWHSAPCRNGL